MASKEKQIILLDEPTSSVDSSNEMQIYENVFKKFKHKTIISSMHRLHLLPMFDTIFFFENGKITATGTLSDLRRNNAKFRKLWLKYKNIN